MNLQYRLIDHKLAADFVEIHHYIHKRPPIKWSWGAFEGEELKGVMTIGKPPSWTMYCGVVGESIEEYRENPDSRAHHVFELNRLWMNDDQPRNSESCFVAWCLRELKKIDRHIILVSYADSEASVTTKDGTIKKKGHIGYVYQALGFLYTGTSAKFNDIHFIGHKDYRSVPLSLRGTKIRNRRASADEPDIRRVPRSRKYRYVWFADPKDIPLLKWKQKPYPKAELCLDDIPPLE